MDKKQSRYSAHFFESLSLLGASKWNGLTGTENPFTRYEFLYELERTGCTSELTGWQPCHLALYEGDTASTEELSPLAVMPLYRKTNSWGEYVFDWSWANAYQSHGYDYYPKLVTSAPFTPSHGQRIFVADGQDRDAIISVIVEKLIEKATSLDLSSWHVLFPQQEESDSLSRLGLKSRIATQFHWHNRDYESFSDFLEKLSSRKRKSIKRERRQVQEQGFQFSITEGSEISDQQWAEFYRFYQSTYLVRGMQGYLKESFFRGLAQTMPEQILMINAWLAGKNTAAALFFKNSEKLFGRYWGSLADYQFLHFETCYYQGQEYAIGNALQSFDSGAQGEHKIQRGFEPILTYSNHWIGNDGFSLAIDRFLQEERAHVESYQDEARGLLPFRRED
ncbi:MAG: GNAT family N-acetyltransferase [Pseudomonadota bacterium]|nr:GNAT family N-acetyltransferase [Pseudomonadota bacterium]